MYGDEIGFALMDFDGGCCAIVSSRTRSKGGQVMIHANVQDIRPAAHAGTLYPAEPDFLAKVVDDFIAGAGQSIEKQVPKVIIAPHGGYVFSGRIAGKAFGGWKGTTVRRVVLIGPSHSYDFPGIALPDTSVFATPLGELHVDREAIGRVEKFAFVRRFEAAHHPELSLEVQLPFIQRLFGEPSIIPLVTGSTDSGQVGKVLETLWGGPETVFVISSDLSQRRPYELVQNWITPPLAQSNRCGIT